VLSSGGMMNFAGSKHWVTNSDARLLEALQFALCLDSIGFGDKLYMHVSKLPKEDNLQILYDGFSRTARQMNIPLEFVHKKINISSNDVYWEHEQFSRKRIAAATLSHFPTAFDSPFHKSDVFDGRSRVNVTILERNIKFVAESLAKYIYEVSNKDVEVFDGSNGYVSESNARFLRSYLDTLISTPRVVPFLQPNSPILQALPRALGETTFDVTNQTFVLESEYTFFDTKDGGKASMSAYKVKPVTFDFLFIVAISIYVAVLYMVLKGPSDAIDQVKRMFSTKEKKGVSSKKKTT